MFTTVAKNHRYTELIVIDEFTYLVGSTMSYAGGWRSGGRDVVPTNPDGLAIEKKTDELYVDEHYDSHNIPNDGQDIASLIGFWSDGSNVISDVFKIGKEWNGDTPKNATELVMGFHDDSNWVNNYGMAYVTVTFDGAAPITHMVFATQCIFFRWSRPGLLGPIPHIEDIDNGIRDTPHRPEVVDVPNGAGFVSIEASADRINHKEKPIEFDYFKVQRYLFDRIKHESLTARQLLWMRGHTASDYNSFLLLNGSLEHVFPDYDAIECDINGPTIVAIRKGLAARHQSLIDLLNRRWTTTSTAISSPAQATLI